MKKGIKRVMALVLAVLLTVGISGAGALMQVTTYEDTVYLDSSDSGPVPPVEPAEPAQPEPSRPEPPLPGAETSATPATEPPAAPPTEWTQEAVNAAVAKINADLETYKGNEPANTEKIKKAADDLTKMPPDLLKYCRPGYQNALDLLQTLAEKISTSVTVAITESARKAGISNATLSGAAITGLIKGAPVVLTIDAKAQPPRALPSDVTGRDMVVLNLKFTVNGTEEKPVLPITVTLPLTRGLNRNKVVVLHYAGTSGEPAWIWPRTALADGGMAWNATFTTSSVGDFVLANYVERSYRSSAGENEAEKRIYEYWRDVIGRIEGSGDGGEIFTNARAAGAKNVPTTVLDALYKKDATLYIEFGAQHEIVVNGLTMLPVPGDKVFYLFWDLANLYAPDGGPAGMRVQLTPVDGMEAPPETHVQTVAPTANRVQSVGGGTQSKASSEAAATSVEETSSREEEQSSAVSSEQERSSVQVNVAPPPKAPGSVPIWAPAAIAAGILAGLGIGAVAGARGKRTAKNGAGHKPQ